MVVFGHDPSFASFSSNFIQVKPWNGDAQDDLLEKSMDFLEALAFSNVPDVRPVISSYHAKDGTHLFEMFDHIQRDMYESVRASKLVASASPIRRFFKRLFMPSDPLSSSSPSSPPLSSPLTSVPGSLLEGMPSQQDLELLSYDERKHYLRKLRNAEYRHEIERIKQEFERQMNASKEYMASHKMPLYDLITKGPPSPPAELLQQASSPSSS